MPTNLALDDALIEQAVNLGKHRTKREAVNAALTEYINRHKRLGLLSLFGKVEYDRDYDYKRLRDRKNNRRAN